MKVKQKIAVGLLFLTILIMSNIATAQNEISARDADHAALRELMKKATEAMNSENVDALTAILAKEFVYTAPDQSVLTDSKSIKDYLNRMVHQPNSPVKHYEIQPHADILTRFLSDNVGYCYGHTDETYTRQDDNKIKMNARWTAVVVKEAGQWKIAAIHSGVNFLDNPLRTYDTMSAWRKIGIFLHLVDNPFKE